jgi:glycosyltransferase involved in cell wall biosynthesis
MSSRTFATLVLSGSYTSSSGGMLVGKRVANTSFVRALFRHSGFESFCFFVGEKREEDELRQLFLGSSSVDERRVRVLNILELPGCLERGDLSVLHHTSNIDRFLDLVWLRDRYAGANLPVTTQLHSLSYPRDMHLYLQSLLWPPSEVDAVFCSTTSGREVLDRCLAEQSAQLAPLGFTPPPRRWEAPVVPLGVDFDALQGGDRLAARRTLGIPERAVVALCIARFTEYDKMDLFPLIQAFRGAMKRGELEDRPLYLVLAGASQGTRTPEMATLWARMLNVGDRVKLAVDFAEPDKRHLLAAADLFVSPSDNPQETFGLTVVEAMAAGLPVVVSDFDGYKDTVTEEVGVRVTTRWGGDLGTLRELGPLLYERPLHLLLGQSVEVDLQALEEAMFLLYRDEDRRAEMGRAARARAQERYAWSAVIGLYEQHWARLAERALETPVNRRAGHPLGMDFHSVFGHYPTQMLQVDHQVRSTPVAELLCQDENRYPIYPEVKNVLDDQEVVAAVKAARSPLAVIQLVDAIRSEAPERPTWHADYLVAWLLKHGLLEVCYPATTRLRPPSLAS